MLYATSQARFTSAITRARLGSTSAPPGLLTACKGYNHEVEDSKEHLVTTQEGISRSEPAEHIAAFGQLAVHFVDDANAAVLSEAAAQQARTSWCHLGVSIGLYMPNKEVTTSAMSTAALATNKVVPLQDPCLHGETELPQQHPQLWPLVCHIHHQGWQMSHCKT